MVIFGKKNCNDNGVNCSLFSRAWRTTYLNDFKDCLSSNKYKYLINHKYLKVVHRMSENENMFLLKDVINSYLVTWHNFKKSKKINSRKSISNKFSVILAKFMIIVQR